MVNLSREYCAYFGQATEVWKQHVIGEVIVAFDEYRDSVCGTLQEADNSGPSASTAGGQDINNQEEMFSGVLENAQQQAEQRIVNALNQTLNQPPPPPILHFPVASIFANQAAQVNPPGESAISQLGVNSDQNDDNDSLDVSIKSELDSSSESECESDTDDDDVQVKEEPTEGEENITGHSEEQTDKDNNNSGDNHETNDSQNDHSNEAANEQEPNAQARMIDVEEASHEKDPNGPNIIVAQYLSPSASPSNAEQSINSFEFNSRSNDNQMNMNEDIASDDEVDHVDAEDDAAGDLEEDETVDNMEIEENDHSDRQESDHEDSMDDEENDGEESDNFEDQVNMSGVEDNDEDSFINDEESSDDTTDDDDAEDEQAAGPSTSAGRRSTRQMSKRQSVPDRQSKRQIKVKKTEPYSIITQKLKCTVPGCKKVVKSKKAMNGHLLSAHKLKRYRCLVRRCYGKVSTSFTTQSQLSDHRDQVHGRTTRLACKCSKKFDNYHDLYSHYWHYHQLGLFACSKDGCTFKPTRTRIKVHHHQYNHREAKYVCPIDGCDRSFKQKCNLDQHTLTHTGERPFPCTECGKSFTEKNTLTRHLRMHRNDKCFRCTWPQCTYSATQRGNVLRHIRVVHFKLPETKKQQAEEKIIDDRDPRVYLAIN